MKKSSSKITLGLVALVLLTFAFVQAGEAPWFDMENCEFCVSLTKDPNLLPHTTWEHHNIDGGIVSVSTVDDEYLPAFKEAMGAMIALGEKMEKEQYQAKMCGSCMAMGALMQKGAKYQYVDTQHGSVSMMTSADPAIVKEIQAWGKKTMEEMAMMEEAAMSDHEGHDH